ncbi:MAG TPA: DUF5683 domain-containing protein [Chitinophagales bacterium]|nr:DUF5683 domain-containing protein [Chitinophagales bacterium]
MNSNISCIAFLMLLIGAFFYEAKADTIPSEINPSQIQIDTNIIVQKDTLMVNQEVAIDTSAIESINDDIQTVTTPDLLPKKSNKIKKEQQEIDPESFHARNAAKWGILPGGGQIYNKRWWKVPIAWGMIGAGGFFIYNSASKMRTYNQALDMRNSGQSDQFAGILSEQQIISYRNLYRRNLQLSVFGTVGLWSLTILDAVVDAHLKTYDISDNLSIKFKPKILRVHNNSVPSFAITLYL